MAIALRYAARSDVGLVRSSNQDSGYAGPHLLVIADGMGGHAGGDVASSLAVGELSVLDGESHGSDDAAEHLSAALDAANAQLRRRVGVEPELSGMGTTVTAILRAGSRLVLAHIGDSRGYLLREGVLTQLTRDHSYVQSLIDEGKLTPEEAEHHPQRSVIMRVLTGERQDTADVSVREARPGDRFLLCSDGLSGVVSHDTLAEALGAGDPPDATCERLVELALRGGGPDNVSCVVADVVELGGGTPPSTTPQVVGAAAFHRPTRSVAAGTPAARARELRAPGSDDEEDDQPGPTARERRRTRLRWVAGPLVLVLLLLAGGYGVWSWSRQQYFVGADDGRVALYRGLTQDIGPLGTSTVLERTTVAVADLPQAWQQRVEDRISATDRAGAEATVVRLGDLAAQCRAVAAAPTPVPSTSAPSTPAPTTPAPGAAPTTEVPLPSPTPSTPAAASPTTSPDAAQRAAACAGIG
ncbi:protein phosphatase 2C domain-containing protein [Kineococcus rubinsiae]|uniref:protein phosphatase 2C domain-containing protein n=1 Tax=Kineococcus rubinsiae TaxID=2609562 RepID=UPI0014322479|nr:protein phosphatase 2C domain-containing protein [Kineococcus rubinsiae]NIZ90751.1 SpoIIE family protein phosphatase [Kineococcus rubinsiae]